MECETFSEYENVLDCLQPHNPMDTIINRHDTDDNTLNDSSGIEDSVEPVFYTNTSSSASNTPDDNEYQNQTFELTSNHYNNDTGPETTSDSQPCENKFTLNVRTQKRPIPQPRTKSYTRNELYSGQSKSHYETNTDDSFSEYAFESEQSGDEEQAVTLDERISDHVVGDDVATAGVDRVIENEHIDDLTESYGTQESIPSPKLPPRDYKEDVGTASSENELGNASPRPSSPPPVPPRISSTRNSLSPVVSCSPVINDGVFTITDTQQHIQIFSNSNVPKEDTFKDREIRHAKGKNFEARSPSVINAWYEEDEDDNDDEEDIVYDDCTSLSPAVLENIKVSQQKRKDIVKEILETEKVYLNKMSILITILKEISNTIPIKTSTKQHKISLLEMRASLVEIYQLSIDIRNGLKRSYESWNDASRIADVFLRHRGRFTIYARYSSALGYRLQLIGDLKKVWHKFNETVDNTLVEYEQFGVINYEQFRKIKIEDHLLEPVQRLPRYRLFFERYQSTLVYESEEYDCVTEVLTCIENVAMQTEKLIETEEIFGELVKVTRRLRDLESHVILNKDRRFIRETAVSCFQGETKKQLQRYLFLFTDMIVISKTEKNKTFRVLHCLRLNMIRLISSSCLLNKKQVEHLVPRIIGLEADGFSIYIVFRNESEKEVWLEEIIKGGGTPATGKKGKKHVLFEHLPKSISCGNSVCQQCSSKFASNEKRIFCATCGKGVCMKCGKLKLHIPFLERQLRNVCLECYTKAERDKPELIPTIESPLVSRKQPGKIKNNVQYKTKMTKTLVPNTNKLSLHATYLHTTYPSRSKQTKQDFGDSDTWSMDSFSSFEND